MTGKMNGKQRLVRCPRCLNVLPEPPDVPVYKCGGCNATLQAKKRNNSTIDTTSRKRDDDSSGKQNLDQSFNDQEAGSSSNQQLLLNSNDKSDRNSDNNDLHRSSKDQDAANKAKNGSIDAPSHGKEKVEQLSDDHEASSSSNQQTLVNPMDEPEPHENTQNDPRSSTELSSHEDPESSPEATDHNRIDQEQEQNKKLDQQHHQDVAYKAQNGSIDAPSDGKQKVKQISYDNEASSSNSNQQSLVNPMDEHEQHQNTHNDPRSSTELSGHEDPESSPEPTGHHRTDQEQEHKQNQKPDQDYYQDASKKVEITTDGAASVDDEKRRNLNQQLMVNSVNSVNDLDQNRDHNEPHNSSELSYHEDPESSPESTVNNRIDHNQDHDQVFLSCRRDFEESSSEFEEAIANTRTARVSDSGSKSSFKTFIAEKLLDTKQKKPVYLDEDNTISEDETADLHHRRTNDRMKTERFDSMNYYGSDRSASSLDGIHNQNPRKHRIGSIPDAHIESGNGYRFNRRNQAHNMHRSTEVRSLFGLNEFDLNRKHRSHMIAENPKLERIELLKMVRELQNQLERSNISNPPQVSSYGRRMAFSGETTAVNGSSCLHCYPQGQNRHFSAQLPRQHVCCNGPHFEPNSSYFSPRFSALSSPIHSHPESEFSATDDYRHRNNDVIRPFRSPKKKRYVRPIASGSPWVTCYRCSTLLELPQSFLVFNKKYHSLRCGACMKVLNFTLSNGTHVSRYYPEETITAPPSSEVEDYDELNRSRAGPVSCSDRSFQKSYSTETDRTMSRDPSASTQPSSKASGRPRLNGSPLHQLMGYASPSKVIRG